MTQYYAAYFNGTPECQIERAIEFGDNSQTVAYVSDDAPTLLEKCAGEIGIGGDLIEDCNGYWVGYEDEEQRESKYPSFVVMPIESVDSGKSLGIAIITGVVAFAAGLIAGGAILAADLKKQVSKAATKTIEGGDEDGDA